MAIEVSCAVWKWSKMKGSQLLLLIAIADYANAEGIAWPSISSLSKRTRLGPRYVQKMLRELEDAHEIETVKRTNTSSVYRVLVRDPSETGGANSGSPPSRTPVHPSPELQFTPGANPSSPNPSGEPSKNLLLAQSEAIYAAYPRKLAKASALKAIGKALAKVPSEKLLTATLAYAAATSRWPEDDQRFIPYPATWFNRGSYDDDPKNWQRTYDAPHSKTNSRALGTNSNLTAFEQFDRDQVASGS